VGFHVQVKKEEEKDDDNNKKNLDDDYTDWTKGSWCWLLPTNNTVIPATVSTCNSRKRRARSRNTTSINDDDTPKKKTRVLAPPLSPPTNTSRNYTTVKQEEDSVSHDNEVNNSRFKSIKNTDDNNGNDDGYGSWTVGNWCWLLPTGSSNHTVKIRTDQHSSEISPANSEGRKPSSKTPLRVDAPDENNKCDTDYSDNDDEPKNLRTGENNTTTYYTKTQNKNWNEMFHRLVA
jgi:hypothetical protein